MVGCNSRGTQCGRFEFAARPLAALFTLLFEASTWADANGCRPTPRDSLIHVFPLFDCYLGGSPDLTCKQSVITHSILIT